MGEVQLFPAPPPLWGEEVERPHCPRCEMRMIAVREPAPKYECLRCGHAEAAAIG
jgi:predicted RNA-binding Zn-ribbon protein involved in translation (DUF1610 family)